MGDLVHGSHCGEYLHCLTLCCMVRREGATLSGRLCAYKILEAAQVGQLAQCGQH